ncbi:putative 6-phosphogluconolactonase 1 isoform X2 [Senna tora]|uniref:Putative 6-phosphogluconolactonase 1 isoform X2 n=1 Tax=Senna tora TaxID=362788 RepID=A0A834WYF1_9FABA|nr:putative 6-phosphogluconolactonase 1 isoform X2 [Senna tora]
MALCEFDEEIIHEGVDELKTDLSDYMLLSDAFVKEPRLFTITSSDASLIRLMGSVTFCSNVLSTRKTVTVSGTRTNFTVYDNTTPKLPPPPPLIAQNRSSPIHIHDPRVDDVIHGEPVLPEHVAVPSAADVPADAHLRTHAGRKRVGSALFPDPVIELPDCHAGLDDGDVVLDIDGDAPEVEEVEDDEWLVRDVGDALEVVAAASDFDLDWDGFGADDGGLDVGFVKRGYDE